MLTRRNWRSSASALMSVAISLAAGTSAVAQSDLPVSTTRVREANAPMFPGEVLAGAKLSDQPRYYLDTVDTLNRVTTDATRTAPGLAKNNYVAKVYPIYNTEAIHIQTYLLRTLAYEGGVAEVMGADGVNDGTGKRVQYLFVTAPDFMIPGITEMVENADKPGFKFYDATGKDFGGGPGAIQYVAKHRTASELTAILSGTELGNIGVFLFPPFADDSTNTIYIVDNPADMADNIAALEMFDKPPLQLELEVFIYEISEGDRGKLGLDWDAWKRFTTGSFEYGSTSGSAFFDKGGDTYTTLLTLDARSLADFLNYTVQSGTTKVLTSTKLTMVNSEDIAGGLSGGGRGAASATPAVVESTVAIPYTVVQADLGGTNSTNARNEVVDSAFEGVRVSILPYIGTQSTTISVDVTVNSLVGYSKDTDIPLISSRKVNSLVNVKDGEPIILGGLEKTNNVKSRVGLPLLKDIPVIQYLFSKETKDTTKSKVVISIKPKLKTGDAGSDQFEM